MKTDAEDNLYKVPPKDINWSKRFRDRYITFDKLHYWNRPLFTIGLIIILTALAVVNVITAGTTAALIAAWCADDLIIDPIRRGMKHFSNVKRDHKKAKGIVGLMALSLGFLIGAIIGYFLLLNTPIAFSIAIGTRAGLMISVTTATIAFAGLLALAKFAKLNPMTCYGLVLLITLFMSPFIFGVGIDVVVSSAVLGAFLATHISKHCMRLYYKITYGHTNADGYSMDVSDEERAVFFGVEESKVKNLRSSLVNIISHIKKISPWYTHISGSRQIETNAYKDMLHMLLHAKKTTDKHGIVELINTSDNTNSSTAFYRHEFYDAINANYHDSSFFTRVRALSNIKANMYFEDAKGFAFKHSIHHLGANYGKAKCYGHKSFDEYQNAAKAFKYEMIQKRQVMS